MSLALEREASGFSAYNVGFWGPAYEDFSLPWWVGLIPHKNPLYGVGRVVLLD